MKLPRLVCVPDAMKLPPLVSGATPAVAAAAAAAPVRIHLGREHDRGPARGVVPRGRRALGRGLVPGAEVGRLRAALIPGDEPHRVLRSFGSFYSSQRYTRRGGAVARAPCHLNVERAARLAAAGLVLAPAAAALAARGGAAGGDAVRAGDAARGALPPPCRRDGKRGGDREHAHGVQGQSAVAGAVLGDHRGMCDTARATRSMVLYHVVLMVPTLVLPVVHVGIMVKSSNKLSHELVTGRHPVLLSEFRRRTRSMTRSVGGT